MSLVKCPECKGPVSSFAESCPHCGFSPKKYAEIIAKKAQKLEEEQRENITNKTREPKQAQQHSHKKKKKPIRSSGSIYDIDDIVTVELKDKKGKKKNVLCGKMGVFECDGKEYIALEALDSSGNVLIYGYKEVGDNEFELIGIKDNAEYKKAEAEFDAIMDE